MPAEAFIQAPVPMQSTFHVNKAFCDVNDTLNTRQDKRANTSKAKNPKKPVQHHTIKQTDKYII